MNPVVMEDDEYLEEESRHAENMNIQQVMHDDQGDQEDVEWEIAHIKEKTNLQQLELLKKEIGHIMAHSANPCEGWFDERFEFIDTYSKLDWTGLMDRFKNKDNYIYETSLYIIRLIDELVEERESCPNFNLLTYYRIINNIYNIWNYYHHAYMGNETDRDVLDLIEGISFL